MHYLPEDSQEQERSDWREGVNDGEKEMPFYD